MNKLNRKLEYALMALKLMNDKAPSDRTTAKEVVDRMGCPFDATARVLQIMTQRGLLRSEQGVRGGYVISQDLRRVSFFELAEMIEGPMEIVRCLQDDPNPCEMASTCNVQSPLQELNRRIKEFYQSMSLKELLEGSTEGSHERSAAPAFLNNDRAQQL
jgi:Rrf2 family protein